MCAMVFAATPRQTGLEAITVQRIRLLPYEEAVILTMLTGKLAPRMQTKTRVVFFFVLALLLLQYYIPWYTVQY